MMINSNKSNFRNQNRPGFCCSFPICETSMFPSAHPMDPSAAIPTLGSSSYSTKDASWDERHKMSLEFIWLIWMRWTEIQHYSTTRNVRLLAYTYIIFYSDRKIETNIFRLDPRGAGITCAILPAFLLPAPIKNLAKIPNISRISFSKDLHTSWEVTPPLNRSPWPHTEGPWILGAKRNRKNHRTRMDISTIYRHIDVPCMLMYNIVLP